ncbi:AI-2E family transporter [Pseudomonas sp. GD03721]|nr:MULTISPECIES: AI-2E family transporter [unclassified Pseudomonas]MDH1440514.1 AI-2E family transporter [Pseudomonas sp. GD03722]WGG03400.1 AI-2E family transporter [Pseudomonas sp. GD03721]WGG07568.1 AI-2E family transporter [Pseudomonas sp. GD03919]
MQRSVLQNRTFAIGLALVTLAFAVLLRPFYTAIFWAATLAVLFWPAYERILARIPAKPSLASLITLLTCVLVVVIPVTLVGASLVQEMAHLYARLREDGGSDIADRIQRVADAAPPWTWQWLERLGVDEFAQLRERASQLATQALQFLAARAVGIGQDTLQLAVGFALMLYLLFFFFRDGAGLVALLRSAIPLEQSYLGELGQRFAVVVRATIKGNLVVAGVQGAIGGVMFWALGIQGPILWGVVMAVLSLLPAVGAWLVWGPVALYLLATGAISKAVIVVAVGAVVIGLIDNLLRPLLVGKDTRMPDYLVLLSTLGGLAQFGLTGFVAGPVVAALFVAFWSLFIARNAQGGADGS